MFRKMHADDACALFEVEPVMVNVLAFVARLRECMLRENRRQGIVKTFPSALPLS